MAAQFKHGARRPFHLSRRGNVDISVRGHVPVTIRRTINALQMLATATDALHRAKMLDAELSALGLRAEKLVAHALQHLRDAS
jgi:hypothetical protein